LGGWENKEENRVGRKIRLRQGERREEKAGRKMKQMITDVHRQYKKYERQIKRKRDKRELNGERN
jgi:hypothetical protein